jgi:hypothetical protein
MTDPITLAVVTAALTHLGLKTVEGTVSEAGKDLWRTVKNRLGWAADPAPDDLAVRIASQLRDDDSLTNELADLLHSRREAGNASALVGRIKAGKVIVAGSVNIGGDFKM